MPILSSCLPELPNFTAYALSEIVTSYMSGPIEGSSVDTEDKYYIFKILPLNFQRVFHWYTLEFQLSDLRLPDIALYPAQPYDVLFTILCSARMHKLKLAFSGKPKKHEPSKT